MFLKDQTRFLSLNWSNSRFIMFKNAIKKLSGNSKLVEFCIKNWLHDWSKHHCWLAKKESLLQRTLTHWYGKAGCFYKRISDGSSWIIMFNRSDFHSTQSMVWYQNSFTNSNQNLSQKSDPPYFTPLQILDFVNCLGR